MWYDYDFYTTDESFDYPTGYGYATHYEKGYHGFKVNLDKDDNVLGWNGYGDYWQAGECKSLDEFYNYVESVKEEYPDIEIMEELLGFIKGTKEDEIPTT